jgi:hypothetical protein
MKINVNNEKGLIEELNKVNAKVRNADAQSVKAIVFQIEKKLEEKGLPKKLWEGLSFWGDINAQVFPNAYKWSPDSTQFRINRFSSGWFVTDIQRMYCSEKIVIFAGILTDEQKEAIVQNFKNF